MNGKRLRGFTLIEMIVVIAIIGVIAAILVPSMLGYVRMSRIRRCNSNAATVFRGAQLACVDMGQAGKIIPASTIFVNTVDGDFECKDSNNNVIDISNYVGEDFHGYFGFITDIDGTGCVYAMWSERRLDESLLQTQMTEAEVKDSFVKSGETPRGCHPLKVIDVSDES
ncbi:MAG: prepilin-type N-terminal cleavage/methylation domain-containing protein [Candidatus Ornithomonoglobus sp.]